MSIPSSVQVSISSEDESAIIGLIAPSLYRTNYLAAVVAAISPQPKVVFFESIEELLVADSSSLDLLIYIPRDRIAAEMLQATAAIQQIAFEIPILVVSIDDLGGSIAWVRRLLRNGTARVVSAQLPTRRNLVGLPRPRDSFGLAEHRLPISGYTQPIRVTRRQAAVLEHLRWVKPD